MIGVVIPVHNEEKLLGDCLDAIRRAAMDPLLDAEPIEVVEDGKSIRMTPSNRLVLKYKIDFNHPAIGKQIFHFDYHHDNFLKKIAPARTFGFIRDVEKLHAAGLARGGSVENCIVMDEKEVINGPLRFRPPAFSRPVDFGGSMLKYGWASSSLTTCKLGRPARASFPSTS